VDQYYVALPGGRSLSLSTRQVELVAIGLGQRGGAARADGDPPIVEAL